MAQTNNFTTQQIDRGSLVKRMLVGAVIALVLIAIFLAGAESNPEWGKFWMIRPLIIVPLAGAMGGLCYHFMDHVRQQLGWNKTLVIIVNVIGYIIGLWLGTVLGLDGTLWD